MPVQPLSLGVRSNPARDSYVSPARLINCYVEAAGEEGKIQTPIYARDTLDLWTTLTGGGPIRAALEVGSYLYVVSGAALFRIDASKSAINLGAINAAGYITIAANNANVPEVCIASSAGNYYVWDGSTLASVSTAAVSTGTLSAITSKDGYILLGFNNGDFAISGINDAKSLDGLDVETAESHPDGITMVAKRGGEVLFFGPNSTEFYQNTGNVDFPWERSTSAHFGCYAPRSVQEVVALSGSSSLDTCIWAASDDQGSFIGVVMLDGYGTRKISDVDLDRKIESEASVTNITAKSWTRNGHVFYAVSGTSWTYVYDTSTGFWHERTAPGAAKDDQSIAVKFGQTVLLGSASNGKIYNITDQTPPTLASVLNVSWSDDGGRNYTTPRSVTIGTSVTLPRQRFKFLRLGQTRGNGRVWKFEITNAFMEDSVGGTITVITPTVQAFPNEIQFNGLYVDVIPGVSQNTRVKGLTGLAADIEVLPS